MRYGPNRAYRQKRPQGVMQLEIVIAAILLGVVITGLTTLNYRLLGVAKDTRHYQFAIHEAANQIEQLAGLGLEGLDDRIARATLSDEATQALPGGVMEVRRVDDTTGTRVFIRIQWDRPGAPAPVELFGWVSTQSDSATSTTDPKAPDAEDSR